MAATKVGFIGLGKMGRPMTEQLQKAGFEVYVNNRSQDVVKELETAGAKSAASPREIAEACDLVLTCLPTVEIVEQVYLGEGGIAEGGKSGQVWIDHSTVSMATNTKCAEAAKAKGAAFLDAPVSGGPGGAQSGTLTIMIGGDEATVAKAMPVFEAMGENIKHCGQQTAGTVVKLVNQLLVGIHTAASAEAFVFGVKAGADPKVMLDLLGTSFGASRMLTRNVPLMLERKFGPATPVSLILKDLGLINALGLELGTRLPLGANSLELFKEAKLLGYGDNDMSAMVLPAEKLANVEVVSKLGA